MITFTSAPKFGKQPVLIFLSQEQVEAKKFPIGFNEKESAAELIRSGQLTGETGEIFPLHLKGTLFLFAGIGKSAELNSTALRIAVKKAILSSYLAKSADIFLYPHDEKDETVQALIEGILIGGYQWKKYFSKDKEDQTIDFNDKKFTIVTAKKAKLEDTIAICDGVTLARNLVNDNADIVTSEFLEDTVKKIISKNKNVQLEILNEKEMKAKGLNLHLAVNQGSPKDPKLIIVKYTGGSEKSPYTALVGKGITFDTGGLNLKPTGSMETMRTDMSGAAAVIGTLKNTLALGLKKNVIFVVGIAENAIGSRSFKPGDVYKSYNGLTVEIGNTDAEGRLVLADAISYVARNYKPSHIIDIATLTGACVIALGTDYSGLVSTDDTLADDLLKSAQETDDRAWRLPSYPEMKNYIKSNYADIKNVGLPRGAAGACTAAEFLRRFTENSKWAHFDIAGTAFVEGTNRLYFGYGATGAGVRLLTNFLQNH